MSRSTWRRCFRPPSRSHAITPKTARPWLPRSDRSELPFAVLLPAAIIGVVLLQVVVAPAGPLTSCDGTRPDDRGR